MLKFVLWNKDSKRTSLHRLKYVKFTLIRPLYVTLTNCDLIGMSSQRFRKFLPELRFQNWRQVYPTPKQSEWQISGFYYFVYLCFIMSYHETGRLAIEVLDSKSLQKLNYVAESRHHVFLISGNMQWNILLSSRSKPKVTWYYWDIKVLYTWIGQSKILYLYVHESVKSHKSSCITWSVVLSMWTTGSHSCRYHVHA